VGIVVFCRPPDPAQSDPGQPHPGRSAGPRAPAVGLILGIVTVSVAALGGCANGSEARSDGGLAPATSGTPGPAYDLTAAERSWPCGALQSAIGDSVGRMRTFQASAKADDAAVAPTLARSVTRLFGPPGAERTGSVQLARERARADAYNGALKARGCAPVDVDALLRAAPTAGERAALPPPLDPTDLDRIQLPADF
jgi:hypothetical protein